MANTAVAALAELSDHLHAVQLEPAVNLDSDLFERCGLLTSTPDYLSHTWKDTKPLFWQAASLLPQLQQDPTILIHFISKLAAPYAFDDIKDVDYERGLDLQAQAFHTLILSLLDKAAASASDAQALANRPEAIRAIVRLWLCSPETGTATQAGDLLVALLRISRDESSPTLDQQQIHQYGSAPIWKRLFQDRDVYALYYEYTTFAKIAVSAEPQLSKREKTIAQARLLEWLPRVGEMDWNVIVTSSEPQIEQGVGLQPGQGLLQYASLKMVDTADDILMHMTLINFFADLITTGRRTPHLTQSKTSLALNFVKEHGIHKEIIGLYTAENPGPEHSILSNRTAHYISEYALTYPEDFAESTDMPLIRQYIHRNLNKCQANELNIISSMPRATLIPQKTTGFAWKDSPILDIPLRRTNPDALKTLATLFHGPLTEPLTFPRPVSTDRDSARDDAEKVFARALTFIYYTQNSNFFADIVKHAELIAMKENALAALTLLRAIITSQWNSTQAAQYIPENDPVYQQLQQFPATGLDIVLDPRIGGGVLPYLLRPATTFSNLVGGRGDAENAAYQIAMAKFDVLKALNGRLEKAEGRQDITAMVSRRVAEGPWGVSGSAGSRIGTLEL